MKRALLPALGALFLASASLAIVDINQNGVSDLWERQYNDGGLFPETFDALSDPDADGWTNAREAAAGTDPFEPNPPDGIIQPRITHVPAVLSVPDEEGYSYIITPEAVTVTWPTLVGKQYTLLFSPDLTEGSWIPVGNPFVGSGNQVEYGFEISGSDKLFWRVAVEDVDTDGDTLTDAEEHAIGSSPYLADTDGDGIDDSAAYASGANPSGDDSDSDGDGVPDKELYSVVFEIQHESHSMPNGIGFEAFGTTDNLHRYLTYKDTMKYSVSGSARYSDVTDGEHVRTSTHLVSGSIPSDGQPVSSEHGMTFSDWKSSHGTTLGEGESLHSETTVTTVDGPTLAATQIRTVTTATTPWAVKKDGMIVRSGTEIITTTEQYDLSDEVAYQDIWNNHVKTRSWSDSPPVKYGPLEWMDYNRAVLGEAGAAEYIRDRFQKHDFGIYGDISSPGTAYSDYGYDNRIKYLRWRWIKFNPLRPFEYEFAAPPVSIRKTFHLVVRQHDYLDTRIWSGNTPLYDELTTKGVVEISCEANEGGEWTEVSLMKFGSYKIENPSKLWDIDFSKWGYSQVAFGNLPVSIIPASNMTGVIGDVIASTIPNSDTNHFVTPKLSAELGQTHVEFVAHDVAPDLFGLYFEWQGGEPGEVANKRKVKRDLSGMTEVKIKSKSSGIIVANMRVWVVWSEVSVTPYVNVTFAPSPTIGAFAGLVGSGNAWRFVFTILPAELFEDTEDRPNLSGKNRTKVPGEDKTHFFISASKADSAINKWDATRQVNCRIYNRELISKSQFPNIPMYKNQPIDEENVASYPLIASEGNDDPALPGEMDEDADLYVASNHPGLTHEIGQISSCDGPRFATPSAPVPPVLHM